MIAYRPFARCTDIVISTIISVFFRRKLPVWCASSISGMPTAEITLPANTGRVARIRPAPSSRLRRQRRRLH